MPAVVASTYFMFLYPLFSIIEFYFEKPKFIMIASSVGAMLNISLKPQANFQPIFSYLGKWR